MKIFNKKINGAGVIGKVLTYLDKFDCKYHSDILNGNYKMFTNWSILQEILMFDADMERTLSFLIVKYGIDFNLRTKKGVSFFHLYLLLLFFHPSFQNESRGNYFIHLLNYGILPNHLMIFNFKKIYSMLDVLYILQNQKNIVPKSFLPSSIETNYKPLEQEMYNKIYLILMCKNEKFFHVSIKKNIPSIHHTTIFNVSIGDCGEPKILKEYLLNQYNLPVSTESEKIKENILYLVANIDFYEQWVEKKQNPFGTCNEKDSNFIFINPDFINNAELQNETFLKPIENKFRFHKTFLSNLIKTKTNPYTRNKIDEKTIVDMIEQNIKDKYIFPISTIRENADHFPFIFNQNENEVTNMGEKNILSYIESFFAVNHPYNQIHILQHLEKFEIKYLSYTLIRETNLFPKFQSSYDKPEFNILLFNLFFYCKNKTKFINVIYFFLEEILQDLQCYKKIKNLLDDSEKNYDKIVDTYLTRFNITNNHYLNKFMKNIYIIKDFDRL